MASLANAQADDVMIGRKNRYRATRDRWVKSQTVGDKPTLRARKCYDDRRSPPLGNLHLQALNVGQPTLNQRLEDKVVGLMG